MAKHRENPIRATNPSGRQVWVARYTTPDGRRLRGKLPNGGGGTHKRKADAQDAIALAYEYFEQTPQQTDTVGAYLPRWLEEHPVSDRTKKTNRVRINAVLDVELEGVVLRDWRMHDLRRRHAKDLVAHMLTVQGRAPAGARNILRALSVMAEDAISDELAEVNPWRSVRVRDDDQRATKQSRQPRIWSWDDMHRFAASAGRYEAMVRTLADCGLRIGELFALERTSVDYDTGTLHVSGTFWEGRLLTSSREKRHDRIAPVPPTCLALLRALPPRIDSPWLFPTPTGKPWMYNNFKRDVWRPAIERAGIAPLPHDFRHSFVTHLRAVGVDAADLADVAGHSVETATARYTHSLGRSYDAIRRAVG